MKKHGFIASVLVALSLALLALPVSAMADGQDDEAVAAYASNVCPSTADGKHVYNRVAELAPTCTEKGHTRGMTCSACGEVFIQSTELNALGHDFTVPVGEVPATCTQPGSTGGKKCSRCDAIEGITAIPATGHKFGDWQMTKEPTCTEAGQKTRACQNAGCTETETQTVEALGHKFGDWEMTKEPTCTEAGQKTRACQNAGCTETETQSVEALGHKMGDWEVTKEPTCTEAGQETRACQNAGCTEKETRSVNALGHDWQKKDGKSHVCTRCKETEVHSFVNKTCEVCGYEKPASGGSSKGLDNVPKTGDVTPVFAFGAVMLLGAAVIVLRRIRLAK